MGNKTPTADSAQQWLSLKAWLNEKRTMMVDRFLRDFSAVWTGERDARPPESLHNETVVLQRKQQKDDSTGTLDGTTAYQFSNDGRLTLIGAGRQHLELSVAAQDQLLAILQARPVPAKPQVIDVNVNPPIFPPTNQQMSMRQNELALRAIKQRQ